ncbi:MAG: hypothetical protein L6R38_004183 [Xanthoria sp. 2 TBL-2021]|nr:MAG: hypothetical protein L6R38_004183 [Xanthoria sp. 2 TBL-2021]
MTTLQTLPGSAHVTASASSTLKRVHPRQVGALVTATINGVVVTWTNVWAGNPQTTEPSAVSTSEPPSPPPIAPGYTWNASPESAATHTSSSAISIEEPTPTFANATQTSAATATPESICGADTGRFTIDVSSTICRTSQQMQATQTFPQSSIRIANSTSTAASDTCPHQASIAQTSNDPFAPISPPQLAVYNYHTDSSTSQSPDAGLELRGELGAGPRVHENAYWIDVYSAWIGCANGGPTDCRIDLIGYDALNSPIATQTLWQRPCLGLVNCKLAQITFSNQFRDLAGLQILAYVNETPVTFYMDDLILGWSNNTCAAQFERSSSP